MSTDDVSTKPAAQTVKPTTVAAPARTMAKLVLDAAARYSATAMGFPRTATGSAPPTPSWARDVRALAKGLIALGVAAGDRVAILSDMRAEWTLADFAGMCAGAIVVPVYQTNSPEECEYVLDHCGASALFCEDDGTADEARSDPRRAARSSSTSCASRARAMTR